MITITKIFEIAYAHYLPNYNGKCANMHGHTGILEVEISGPIIREPYQGMILDFGSFKEIVLEKILTKLDHQAAKLSIEIPTAENIVVWIANELEKEFGYNL